MAIDPEDPSEAVPVDKVIAPLTPASPEFGVCMAIEPLDVSVLAPLVSVIEPPVAARLDPASIETLPEPADPAPTANLIAPPVPLSALAPVEMDMPPEEPSFVAPVPSERAPEVPFTPAFTVQIEIAPLVVAAP
jgi:hypothetical protein